MIEALKKRFLKKRTINREQITFNPKDCFYPSTPDEQYFYFLRHWDSHFKKPFTFIASLDPNAEFGEWIENLEIQNVGQKQWLNMLFDLDDRRWFDEGTYEIGVLGPKLYIELSRYIGSRNQENVDWYELTPVVHILPSGENVTQLLISFWGRGGDSNLLYTFSGDARDALVLNRGLDFLRRFKQGIQDVANERRYYGR